MIAVLKDKNTKKISFSLGGSSLDASSFVDVATAIRDRSISVEHSASLASDEGRYYYKPRNKFKMGFRNVGANEARMALVVHEAAHASFDLRRLRMKVKESEAAAYVAQTLYFYYAWGYDTEDLSAPTFTMDIMTAAWPIAESVAGGGSVDAGALNTLYTKIGAHPDYHGRLELDEDFDG